MQEWSETFNFNNIKSEMLWNFKNFILNFINGEWWHQKQTNLQNKQKIS